MALVRNISTGPRGAYLKGAYVEAEPGQTIEADDYADEWFGVVDAPETDGKKGGAVRPKAKCE